MAILTRKNGEEVALYLPVILYSKEKGFDIFSSKKNIRRECL